MLTITPEEFCEKVDDPESLFCENGNPLCVECDNGKKFICMSWPLYQKMTRKQNVLSSESERQKESEDDVRYWMFDIWIGEEELHQIQKVAEDNELTLNELLECFFRWSIRYPEELKQMADRYKEEQKNGGLDDIRVELLREYPVHKNETEAQARKKCEAGLCGTNYVKDKNSEEEV